MKIFKLPKLADSASDGSFRLGTEELGSDAVYMLYTRLRPGEGPKKFVPADGAEEIIFVMKGNLRVKSSKTDFLVGPGEAFHSKGATSFQMENIGSDDAVFISAGGRAAAKAARPAEGAAEETEAVEKEEKAEEEENEFIITREDGP